MSINNEDEFKLEQNNKTYSINISIQEDQLSLILILISNPLQKYSGFFSLNELRISSKIFEHTKTLFEAKEIIKRTVIKKQLLIDSDEFKCKITFDTGLGLNSVPFPITLFRDSDDRHPRISLNNTIFKNNNDIKEPGDNLQKSFILNMKNKNNNQNNKSNANTNAILRASIGNNVNNKMLNNNLNFKPPNNDRIQFNNSMRVLTSSKIFSNNNLNNVNNKATFKEIDLRNNMNLNNKVENGLNNANYNGKDFLTVNNNILHNIYNNMNNNNNIESSFYKDLNKSFAQENQNKNYIQNNNYNNNALQITNNNIVNNNNNNNIINNNKPYFKKGLINIDNNYSMYKSNIFHNYNANKYNTLNNMNISNQNNTYINNNNIGIQNQNLTQNNTPMNPTLLINNQSFHTAPIQKNLVQIPNMDTQINQNIFFNNEKRKTYNNYNNKKDNMRLSISDSEENNDNMNSNLNEDNQTEKPYRFKNLLIKGSKRVKGNLEKFKKNQNMGDYIPAGTKFVSYLKFPETKNVSNKSLTLSTITSSITSGSNRIIGIEKNIIKHPGELDEITSRIQRILKKKNIKYKIIYRSNIDGDSASTFHEKCDKIKNTLILIKAAGNKRFGGFTTQTWDGNDENKIDNNCFIFSIDKMKVYDVIEGQDAINCNPDLGPVFLNQIKLFDQFFIQGGTTSKKGQNFMTSEDFEITGGAEKFGVQEVEVYQIK